MPPGVRDSKPEYNQARIAEILQNHPDSVSSYLKRGKLGKVLGIQKFYDSDSIGIRRCLLSKSWVIVKTCLFEKGKLRPREGLFLESDLERIANT